MKSHSIMKLMRTRQRIGLYMDFYSNQLSLSFVFATGLGRVTYCKQWLECEAQLFHQEERRGGGSGWGQERWSLAIPTQLVDLLPKCDMVPLKSLHETLNWKSVPCFGSNKMVNISLSLCRWKESNSVMTTWSMVQAYRLRKLKLMSHHTETIIHFLVIAGLLRIG